MKKILSLLLVLALYAPGITNAQTVPDKKPSPQWWMNSSMADTIDRYLYHSEGQFNYTRMTGAIDGEMYTGTLQLAVRKSIITNHTEYIIDKMNLSLKTLGMDYSSESQVFTNYLNFDITRLVYGEAGFIWERDNTLYLKNRYSLYAGIGLNGLIYEKHYLKILTAVGRMDQDYTIPVDNFDVVKGAYTALYIRQQYKYVMDSRFSVMEQAYYLTNMNKTDRYRMSVSLNFMVGIIQPVSLMFGYSYKYDNEAGMLGAIAKNTTQTIGINISI